MPGEAGLRVAGLDAGRRRVVVRTLDAGADKPLRFAEASGNYAQVYQMLNAS